MKKILSFVGCFFFAHAIYSQIETNYFYKGDAFNQVEFIKNNPQANIVKDMPSFDTQILLDEDNMIQSKDVPFRFGKEFDINIPLSEGFWINIDDVRIWSMRFRSKGAYSINFVFEQFFLPKGAELYIINQSGTVLYGPVSSEQNTKNGVFLTDLIEGDDVTLYLYEPTTEKGNSKMTIKKVVHAYKGISPNKIDTKSSGSCNNDIECFQNWDLESDAVALVLLANGSSLCS